MVARRQYDITIAGAGLAGSSLACVLASTSYRIALIDCQPLPAAEHVSENRDGRSIALALASKEMYATLGLWDQLEAHATPIKKIHISDQGQFGATRLDCARYDVESFGYLIPAERLSFALHKGIQRRDNLQRLQPYRIEGVESRNNEVILHGEGQVIHAKLLIAADGTRSFIRNTLGISVEEKQYGQTAVVGSLDAEDHHRYTAYERFTESGPLALLPRTGNRCGFIWMNPDTIAEEYATLSNKRFLERLQKSFGYRLGYFSNLGQRFTYPLSLLISQKLVQQRVILVGNAAQTLHPIAGQGLNLALRDIADLGEVLATGENIADDISERLFAYETRRRPDIENSVRFTDRLNSLFTAHYPGLPQVRGLGLALVGAIPPLEERIVRQNLGTLSSLADSSRGQTLQSSHA